jgi:hypothetical protein
VTNSTSRSTSLAFFACLLATLMLAAAPCLAHDGASNGALNTAQLQDARRKAAALTQALAGGAVRYSAARRDQRGPLETALLAAAEERFVILSSLLDEDPKAVLDLSLSAEVVSKLPSSLNSYLEQDAELNGTLAILHEDTLDGGRYHYVLYAAGARCSLHFVDGAPSHLRTDAKIRVKGKRLGDMLALGGGGSVQQTAPAPLPKTLGALRTLVILVNFSDNPTQPYTVDDAHAAMFGVTSSFFMENSYQQSWLVGDVYGWFTIPVSGAVCDYTTIASAAQNAAVAAGANLAAYDHLVYAFPQNACQWWGLSSVGGLPSQSWINGAFELTVLGHELGHGLGLYHAHALDCGTAAVGSVMTTAYPPAPGTCFMIEYGDIIDMMGSAYPGHYSAFQKERLGWLNAGLSPPATTITTSGTYTLESLEIQSGNPKALKILKSQDPTTGAKTWYYVEARQPIGFDSVLNTTSSTVGIVSTIPNGVLVHVGTEGSGNSGALLDMNPATDMSIWDWLVDAPLLAGQTFTDPGSGVTMTTQWVNSTAAAVTVSLGASTPSISTTVTVTTDQTTYTRGQSAAITAKVSSGGSPVANATVTFQIVKPTGSVVNASATTGKTGTAVYMLRLRKQDPVGIYQADAKATKGSQSSTAETTFTVK